jgi:hypothetical protein
MMAIAVTATLTRLARLTIRKLAVGAELTLPGRNVAVTMNLKLAMKLLIL